MNEIICGDALAELRRLPTASVGTVITSPPYNLGHASSGHKIHDVPANIKLRGGIVYDNYSDDLATCEYLKYQRAVADELWRVLRPDGVMFYNHKERVVDGRMQEHGPEILGDKIRQRIVWNRMCGYLVSPDRLTPIHEYIYLCPKPAWTKPVLKDRLNIARGSALTVWSIAKEDDAVHPAPFPLELAHRCVVMGNRRGPVLDPYMGSGTTALAAMREGLDWLGIDMSEKYVAMAKERIATHSARPRLFRSDLGLS